MPAIAPFLLAAAAGGLVGFGAGRGTEGLGEIVKWGVIGGVGFVAWQALRKG